MKIVITGHTSGIGKYFYDYYLSQGHTVEGFSRTTGHNIATSQSTVLDACKDCDIFFNNAYSGFAQAEVMFKFAQQYKHTNKTIVNIGSSITQRFDRYTPEPQYRAAKLALEEACKETWTDIDREQLPLHVIIVHPCKTITGRTLQNPFNTTPMPVAQLCDLVINCLNTTDFRVRQLGLGLNFSQ